jgi:hypothetical protein
MEVRVIVQEAVKGRMCSFTEEALTVEARQELKKLIEQDFNNKKPGEEE